MKKKKVIIFVIVFIIALMLIPIPTGYLKDGGSKVYRSLLYKITKVHRIPEVEYLEKGYDHYEGYEIEILGFKVFDNTKLVKVSDSKDFIQDQLFLTLKENSLTKTGAIFTLKNDTDKEYWYGPDYYIEYRDNGDWKELDTITGEPLVWNSIAYVLKPGEEKELNIDWSYGYGELKNGEYRLVKKTFKEENRPIDNSKLVYLYATFKIK